MQNCQKWIQVLARSPLFHGIEPEILERLMQAMAVRPVLYKKDAFLLRQDGGKKRIGVVIEGNVHIIREDFLGSREILTEVGAGEIFNEVYALLSGEYQHVAAVAVTETKAVFFPVEKLLSPWEADSDIQMKLLQNMMRVLARRNLFLTRKMAHLSQRSIREKVVSYLSEERDRQGSMEVKIPFNRQQLADYLSVERSALSRELSRMQKSGLITYRRNQFVLHQDMGEGRKSK